MNQESVLEKNLGILLLFMIVAYAFSMGVRMFWPIYFENATSMYYAGQLMINTNDGYFFATGARDIIDGITAQDVQRASAFRVSPGLVALTAYVTKFLPFSLDTVILYLPAIISSLIVIPIVLTGRLLGNTVLGFLAALIGSTAWSYYNRTMVGYYDTDMFSVFLQFMIFYSFMEIVYTKTIRSVILATFWVLLYPLFYSQGITIVYTMFIVMVLYMILEYKGWIQATETKSFKENIIVLYATVILLSIALMIAIPIELRMLLAIITLIFLLKASLKEKHLWIIASFFFLAFLIFGNIFTIIFAKIISYTDRGLDEGTLQFYQVVQTVREAGAIPFQTMAERISGSQMGVILSLIGYFVLLLRHKQFIVALPLIGIGVFSLIGGLRFTVYAVPVAALSFVYLFFVIGGLLFKENRVANYVFALIVTVAMLYPNIIHVIEYKVPTVMNKAEVEDLVKLDEMASDKDYTLTWWDYGYPIWYYSNTNTLIDGGKHTHDNYIVSKLMFSTSQQQIANLSRLAIETYVDSNYSMVADILFKDKNPNQLLEQLKNSDFKLPQKTRDVYLYMPYRMINIFPTVGVFSNLDLITGKKERNIAFYPTNIAKQNGALLLLANGIVFDMQMGTLRMGERQLKVNQFDIVSHQENGTSMTQSQLKHLDGEYCVVFLKSYGNIIVMDQETYKSAYVQMFMLEKYDKNLFELVVSSPYSKIYKIKKIGK